MKGQAFGFSVVVGLVLLVLAVVLALGAIPTLASSSQPQAIEGPGPSTTPGSTRARMQPAASPHAKNSEVAPGYCPAYGGSTEFESIQHVYLLGDPEGVMQLMVELWIANPTGCTTGKPCPAYDDSPEFVNAWIDWNGNKQWEASERVMNDELRGYDSINYRDKMLALSLPFRKPAGATEEPTWLRANLGWQHDPNDPCETLWRFGNVVDQPVHPKPVKIKEITAKGIGTFKENPETGRPVRMEALLEVDPDYKVTICSWTGDLVPGEGASANNCRYHYRPATGPGPDRATYGPKRVKLTVTARHIDSGLTLNVEKEHTYRVFFQLKADDNGDKKPNWFHYWADDGAVPGLKDTHVSYDPTLGSKADCECFGTWPSGTGKVRLGREATWNEFWSIPANANCPGGEVSSVRYGIHATAATLAHENRHRWIWNNWKWPGGAWSGKTDSDASGSNWDGLPDEYETATTRTSPNLVDSCGLQQGVGWSVYEHYGDNEFQARLAEIGAQGVVAKDWASPGAQTVPPRGPATAGTDLERLSEAKVKHLALSGPLDGRAPDGPAVTILSPADSGVTLKGTYVDSGMDSDGDGRFDSLKLAVGVQVTRASTYNLVAWLEDSAGAGIAWARAQQALAVGNRTVDLFFDGQVISSSGLDGPYTIPRVELRALDEEWLLDVQTGAHVTAAYLHTAFDPPDLAIVGILGDSGVDTNGDGLYDLLRLGLAVDVQRSGTYTLTAELEGSGVGVMGQTGSTAEVPDSIVVASKTISLPAGSQAVDLDFDGEQIFQHRQHGPYQVRKLRAEDGSEEPVAFIYDAHTSGTYTYGQFQHDGTTLDSTSFSDEGWDVDGDGDFDYLRVAFRMNVAQEGAYRLSANLLDQDDELIDGVFKDLDWETGLNTVSLEFPGGPISGHGADGPYRLAAVAVLAADGTIVDYLQSAHATAAYRAADFSPSLVTLSGSYQDHGRDTNGDGEYESLEISVGVKPGDAGVIVAQGRLVDRAGQEIAWAEKTETLDEGVAQPVVLSFDAESIRANRRNGPFELWDLLVYHSGDPLQYALEPRAHTTAAYDLVDFGGKHAALLPLAMRPSEQELLYSDDFGNPGSGWPVMEYSDYAVGYESGVYGIRVKRANMHVWALAPSLSCADCIIQADAWQSSGSSLYGLVFGVDNSVPTYYSFTVDPFRQEYALARYDGSAGWATLIPAAFSAHIGRDTAHNRLRVARKGAEIRLFVNDQLLATKHDSTYTGAGRMGVAGVSAMEAPVSLRYDNFFVWGPAHGTRSPSGTGGVNAGVVSAPPEQSDGR